MKFDWRKFCDDQGVEYAEAGGKVSRGNIGIQCPFCDDRGQHMGLSLTTSSWGCWRCKSAGRNPLRLLCKLTGLPTPRAQLIIDAHNVANPDDFEGLFDQPQDLVRKHRTKALELPEGCRPLYGAKVSGQRFLDYLANVRGFGKEAGELARQYHLHYAMTGDQAWRVVYPVFYDHRLVAWTGRSIYEGAELRYKADEGNIKNYVSNFDQLLEESTPIHLAVVEGPMDFLKLDFYGQACGLRATCTFGTSWKDGQVSLLLRLVKRFERTSVIFDRAAYMDGAGLAGELSDYSGKPVHPIMIDQKDPGAMTRKQVEALASNLNKETQ